MNEIKREFKTPEYVRKASAKYDAKKVDQITLRVPKGKTTEVKKALLNLQTTYHNNPRFKSLNAFIISLLEENLDMEITGVLQETKLFLAEREARQQWLDHELFHLPDTTLELMGVDADYKEFVLFKLNNQWEEVKGKVVADYLATKGKQNTQQNTEESEES